MPKRAGDGRAGEGFVGARTHAASGELSGVEDASPGSRRDGGGEAELTNRGSGEGKTLEGVSTGGVFLEPTLDGTTGSLDDRGQGLSRSQSDSSRNDGKKSNSEEDVDLDHFLKEYF